MNTETETKGRFLTNLHRSNKEIREDRAIAIAKNASRTYKRNVEDMEARLEELEMDQENMLDQSPTDAHSLKMASDFNAVEFAQQHLAKGNEIHNLRIRLDIARSQYSQLFGEGNVAETLGDQLVTETTD